MQDADWEAYKASHAYVQMSANPSVDRLLNRLEDALPKGHPDHHLVIETAVLFVVLTRTESPGERKP